MILYFSELALPGTEMSGGNDQPIRASLGLKWKLHYSNDKKYI